MPPAPDEIARSVIPCYPSIPDRLFYPHDQAPPTCPLFCQTTVLNLRPFPHSYQIDWRASCHAIKTRPAPQYQHDNSSPHGSVSSHSGNTYTLYLQYSTYTHCTYVSCTLCTGVPNKRYSYIEPQNQESKSSKNPDMPVTSCILIKPHL